MQLFGELAQKYYLMIQEFLDLKNKVTYLIAGIYICDVEEQCTMVCSLGLNVPQKWAD